SPAAGAEDLRPHLYLRYSPLQSYLAEWLGVGAGAAGIPPDDLGIYATLGVFLLLAARDPARNVSLIWFTVWSSIVHGAVMAVHSVTDPGQIGHLWGDVAALFLTAVVLTVPVRRELPVRSRA